MQAKLEYTASADWVIQNIQQDLPEQTNATIRVQPAKNRVNCGMIIVSAKTQGALDAALVWISRHPTYKDHFKRK